MPIYEFHCEECGHEFEELVARIDENAPCPKCGSQEVGRLISATADYRGSMSSPGSGPMPPCANGMCPGGECPYSG